ncbi:MAG: helicase-exonuclease AddAB subunit AddA [Eubacterium sp.]|nr:helicase-exonuclease AddAB subunit AddA [Eubacterium sp.]
MTEWNESQKKVLESLKENKNILVSAAAGSGKTAVLVERIIRSIIEDRCGIDELLVVTFTRAAAAQMKGKIIKELEKVCESGEKPELVKQLSMAEKADITTIDGFCNHVVKDNFSLIGIDPSYDFYDAQEAKMLQEDILEECFEEWYRTDEKFEALSRIFMKKGMEDSQLKEAILSIYKVSQSHADEAGFFENMREEAEVRGDEVRNLPWIKAILSDNAGIARNVMENLDSLRTSFEGLSGTENEEAAAYMIDMLDEDIKYFFSISHAKDIEEMYAAAYAKQKTFSKKKLCVETFGSSVAEYADYRKNMQKLLQNIPDINSVIIEQDKNRWMTIELIDCAEKFSERLLEEKRRNRKYEFGDIAHFAYEVLGDITRPMARDLRNKYKYIYIDEYQDSNDLQEEILNAVARHDRYGRPCNIFMVGDVKQSIYRFRLAKPRLFMDKSNLYTAGIAGLLFNLNTNYRSCREILEGTNFIFRNLMKKELGGIEYDKEAELNYPEDEVEETEKDLLGEESDIFHLKLEDDDFDYEEEDEYNEDLPELILMTDFKDDEDYESESDLDRITPDEAEAMLIGKRIKELNMEGVNYGDITILMRTVSGTEPMIDIMKSMGIPVKLESSNGYFDAAEVVTLLSILSVIDNSRQDIPYVSVLLSEIGRMTEAELAVVVTRRPLRRRYMYDMCIDFANAYKDSPEANLKKVSEKILRIEEYIAKWKGLKSYISIAELIDIILADTGYDVFVSSMPSGEIRLANLRMLRFRAEKFEKSGFTSLFDFLRYIEKCKIHDIDFGKAETLTDVGNAVHVSSIHSSKGLEYPVVILARTGHGFNMKDNSSKVIVDPDFGIAHDVYETSKNGICITRKGIRKEAFKSNQKKEMIAEEMRLLYVAFTRAKEKLIITGRVTKDFSQAIYSFDRKLRSRSFLDMIIPAVNLPDFEKCFTLRTERQSDVISEITGSSAGEKVFTTDEAYRKLKDIVNEKRVYVDNPYNYTYPYLAAVTAPSKAAVSGIERAYTIKLEEEGIIPRRITADKEDLQDKDADHIEDSDVTGQKDIYPGTRRGTVIHKIMELLDYSKIDSRSDMNAEIDRIMKKNFFTDEDRANLRRDMVLGFHSDDEKSLFRRMKKAAERGMLYREKSFLMGMKPSDIPGMGYREEDFGDDMVTVQGIVDAFFYETGEDGKKHITLVDYKTDNVKTAEELIERYSVQLELYALSLSRITDAEIDGIIFYCFKFHEEVNCPVKIPGHNG